MNDYVTPCITQVGGKHVVADGFWTTNENVASNNMAVIDTAVALGTVAIAVIIAITY